MITYSAGNRLRQWTLDTIDTLANKYLVALERSSKDIQTGRNILPDNFGKVLAKVLPEILSRLCCRCSLPSKYRILHFLLGVYESPYRGNYDKTQRLTKRLLDSFSIRQRFDLIPTLLDFPYTENYELHAPNPFNFLDLDKESTEDWAKPTIPAEKIDALLEQGSSSDQNARQWAVFHSWPIAFFRPAGSRAKRAIC